MSWDRTWGAVVNLDLSMVKLKLMQVATGEGWSQGRVNAIEFEYCRFLYLMKKFPNERTAPLVDVDIFWHHHILDTKKYAVDCQAIFGYFLHHFPYVGMRGEQDKAAHLLAGQRMQELYEQTFGKRYARDQGESYAAAMGKVSNCAAADKAYNSAAAGTDNYAGAIAQSGSAAFYGIRPRLDQADRVQPNNRRL